MMAGPWAITTLVYPERTPDSRGTVFGDQLAMEYRRAGDGTRTRDVKLGKLAFYH